METILLFILAIEWLWLPILIRGKFNALINEAKATNAKLDVLCYQGTKQERRDSDAP